MNGIETLETETTGFQWPTLDLNIGDSVENGILDEGEGDAPAFTKRSSESPTSLFTSPKIATKLLQTVSDFEARVMELLDDSKAIEPESEHRTFEGAVGRVAMELGDSFLYPIYRRHSELVPEGLRGELL